MTSCDAVLENLSAEQQANHFEKTLGERNWREDKWRGEFDQSDSILFVCQRRENFSSSNSIIVYISHEFYIEFPAAHRYPWCNAQRKFALSRSPSTKAGSGPVNQTAGILQKKKQEKKLASLRAVYLYLTYFFSSTDDYAKMADQEQSDFHSVFNMILFGAKFCVW